MYEAIILCGGEGWRLKPETWVPKPLLKIDDTTLLDRQTNWLANHGFDSIILAASKEIAEELRPHILEGIVKLSIEEEKLGTGGATKKAVKLCESKKVYVMNIDDIVFYDPKELYEYADKGGAILMAKPVLPFGKILTKGSQVLRFEQKPPLKFYVNAGHYVLKTDVVREFFPERGDMELQTFQRLADLGKLKGYKYNGLWLTINTMKDLIRVREYLERR
ncbi:MAG: NDP-sugar synthase [Candidatus Bathyarchaeota archaeon]|nr:MAG: NDP-sugar synthase [Candidatus Bathyarchaeota archaeon]